MQTLMEVSVFFALMLAGPLRAEQLLISFSSNLESSGGCHRDDPSGADLYTVVLDLNSTSVTGLTRLTDKTSEAEWFSSISPNGRLILFNHTRFFPRTQAVLVYDRRTCMEYVLFRDARFPHWYSNTEFCYSDTRGRPDCHYARLAWKGARPEIAESRPITSPGRCPETRLASDPSPFPDGSRIAFHVLRGAPGAAVAVLDTNGANHNRITPWNSSGHVDVSPSGGRVVFSMASTGRPQIAQKSDNWASPKPLPLSTDPRDWVSYDRRYGSVDRVGWDYGEWAGSDRRILFSGQGYAGRKTVFSRLFLFTFNSDFTSVETFDISSAVEALAGKTGRDFCTAFAVIIRDGDFSHGLLPRGEPAHLAQPGGAVTAR